MTEITYIKKLIEDSEGLELSNWNTATHAQREAWASIETQGRAWIIDFITTIESQAWDLSLRDKAIAEQLEELDGVRQDLSQTEDQLSEAKALMESQKEFIKDVQDQRDKAYDLIDVKDIEIESLKAITELAVKGLKQVCYYAPTGTDSFDAADNTLSEIERLQNE